MKNQHLNNLNLGIGQVQPLSGLDKKNLREYILQKFPNESYFQMALEEYGLEYGINQRGSTYTVRVANLIEDRQANGTLGRVISALHHANPSFLIYNIGLHKHFV